MVETSKHLLATPRSRSPSSRIGDVLRNTRKPACSVLYRNKVYYQTYFSLGTPTAALCPETNKEMIFALAEYLRICTHAWRELLCFTKDSIIFGNLGSLLRLRFFARTRYQDVRVTGGQI